MGTDRGYERPWTANMKRHNTGIGEVASLRKPKIKPGKNRQIDQQFVLNLHDQGKVSNLFKMHTCYL